MFQLTFVDDLLPEKKGTTINTGITTNSSGACVISSSSSVNVMNKPLSKTNATSSSSSSQLCISIPPKHEATSTRALATTTGNGSEVILGTSTQKSTSGTVNVDNELKVRFDLLSLWQIEVSPWLCVGYFHYLLS